MAQVDGDLKRVVRYVPGQSRNMATREQRIPKFGILGCSEDRLVGLCFVVKGTIEE